MTKNWLILNGYRFSLVRFTGASPSHEKTWSKRRRVSPDPVSPPHLHLDALIQSAGGFRDCSPRTGWFRQPVGLGRHVAQGAERIGRYPAGTLLVGSLAPASMSVEVSLSETPPPDCS